MNSDYLNLMRMKLDILKLKSDDYGWQCHVPKDVKEELEKMLFEINLELNPEPTTVQKGDE